MHPATPMPPQPPLTMRLSSGLLFGAAALILLDVIVDLVFVNTDLSVYKDAYTGDTGSGFGSLVGATIGILVAAVVSILAIMNSHGSEKARVTTLVLGGLFLVCSGFFGSLAGGLHSPSAPLDGGGAANVIPGAYGIVTTALDVLNLLAVLGGLVLLVLPPSTRYFHSRRPVAYIPVYHTTTGQPVIQHPVTPPPPSAPPQPPQPPHSASIPMADPWAEPDARTTDHRPRHHGDPQG
ncbi:hypothetical protein [Actinoplanes sp. NBRC 103695]|uniref:hypothetical protein n=1 Tax=Actinoplanes sp. NBRC 103695 TaxID=3032202 RepID=UPI0024A3B360|nr:hypothetical protein [Actinoplanes sp. NBRC 103695]GLY99421.1 hypothetical protein Acsp02_66740 [Actinoplanes sp. NBRC 103695]